MAQESRESPPPQATKEMSYNELRWGLTFSQCVLIPPSRKSSRPHDETVSPACDLCDAQDDGQDEQHTLFKGTSTFSSNFKLVAGISHASAKLPS
eukprot:1148829-Pelagomonas_calceolata.AAC.6